jgi:cellulose synthase/poly-beta-1,6-N-acetylglucosamine synthase-like glycosyltransferase
VDAYWRLEKAIRQWESELDSSVGCTGAVYAIRRDAFTPMTADTILDDVVVPMQIAAQGLRVRFDPAALAYDPQTLGGEKETRRKVRTLAGNFQMLSRYPSWLLPWGHRLWWKLMLHKYLRLAGPALLVLAFLSSLMLRDHVFYRWALIAQIAFYGAALTGWMMPGLKLRALSLPAGFVFLQVCVVRGFGSWLSMDSKGGWR